MAAAVAAATTAEDEARLLRLEEQAEHGGGGAWEYLCLARRLRARRPAHVLRVGLALLNNASARSGLASEQWTLYEQVAVAAMDCQRLDVAKDCIGVLSKQFPGSTRVARLEALLFEAKGECTEAERAYALILENNPFDQIVHKRKIAIAKAQGDMSIVVDYLNKYLELFMADHDAWRELAETYVSLQMYKQAAFCYEELILAQPTIPLYHIAYAELEHQVRRKCSPLLESVLLPGGSDSTVHEWKAVPDIWRTAAEKYADLVAVIDPYHEPPTEWTYTQLEQEILDFSQGLRAIGVAPDEKLALFADNSCRWLVADQGIMATGAINVVRGTRSSDEELFQIYTHSESIALVVDSPQFFNRLAESFISRINTRFIVLLWGDKSCIDSQAVKDIPLYGYKDITELGRESRNALFLSGQQGQQDVFETISPEDVATLIYTSGTSGTPKGVMLTHRNLLHQINNLWEIVPAEPGDRFLSMLPPWHAYERACEYFIFSYGIQQVYTTVKYLKEDLQRYQPHYIISVPLVYETLYSSIQKQISSSSAARKIIALSLIKISLLYMDAKKIYEGTVLSNNLVKPSFIAYMLKWLWARLIAAFLWPLHNLAKILVYKKIHSAIGISKAGISGGGSLPMHVDKFFEAIGIKVQNGYGLTETSPVVAARRPFCNVLGTIGHPIKHTEIKVFDIETGEVLPDGSKGIVKIKGPQVMKGYYKNPLATNEAFDQEGWFSTGDIGWIVPHHAIGPSRKCGGMLVLEGRAKDTIVLSTGENVEPAEIEEAAGRSNLINQIVVIGQDQRRLGAIIVPNNDEVLAEAKRKSILGENGELAKDKVMNMLYDELKTWTAHCSFRVGPIMMVDEPFTIDNGLMTPTMKIRRDKVTDKYRREIEALFK